MSEPTAESVARETLFQAGDFRLHSGAASSFKIECDALTDTDWRGIAAMCADCGLIPPDFSEIVAVPRGGIPFAAALRADNGDMGGLNGPRLIVDDVLTTGGSILAIMDRPDDIGLVVFARGPLPPRVTALFSMPAALNAARADQREKDAAICDEIVRLNKAAAGPARIAALTAEGIAAQIRATP